MSTVKIEDAFRHGFRQDLLDTYFAAWPEGARSGAGFEADVHDHVEGRFHMFDRHIAPWVASVADISRMTVLEFGSGTGSSTLAFAPRVGRMLCYEIAGASTAAARRRMRHFGIGNVEIREEAFSTDSARALGSVRVDMILLCAVLEHMTFEELRSALQTAWSLLQKGGLLVVADTPNRLNAMDHHTSRLPFFACLPAEIRREYAVHSEREGFRNSIAQAAPADVDETITRWGAGVSYHDFDIAIGRDYHRHIVLDGYEPILSGCVPLLIDDALLQAAFAHYQIPAHRAFTRHNLHFVIRKP